MEAWERCSGGLRRRGRERFSRPRGAASSSALEALDDGHVGQTATFTHGLKTPLLVMGL